MKNGIPDGTLRDALVIQMVGALAPKLVRTAVDHPEDRKQLSFEIDAVLDIADLVIFRRYRRLQSVEQRVEAKS